jgi:hypothetical protein
MTSPFNLHWESSIWIKIAAVNAVGASEKFGYLLFFIKIAFFLS